MYWNTTPGRLLVTSAQPLLGLAARAHLARQAAHPPGADQRQRGQARCCRDQPRQVAAPGPGRREVDGHPATQQALALVGADAGQAAVHQRDQVGRLARGGEVELRRQLLDLGHGAQQAVVVVVDADVGKQLHLHRGLGLSPRHHVHGTLAAGGLDHLDLGVSAGPAAHARDAAAPGPAACHAGCPGSSTAARRCAPRCS